MSFLLRFKVSGHSMLPTLKPGQEILVSSLPYLFIKPRVGDVIAFKDGDIFIVKRITEITGEKLHVMGDNKNDSRDYSWIERKRVIGKVIYIYA
jgi:signal peptidase I